jgi:type I restriction enzyme S subunit
VSWPMGKLGDIAEVVSGFAFKSTWFGEGTTRVIRIGDLQNGRICLDKSQTIDSIKHPVKDQFKIRNGDILMAMSGATVGKIAVADEEADGALLNQRVVIVRANNIDSSNYLKYAFSGDILSKLLLSAGGAAQPNLSPKDLFKLIIPIPPLAEQKRIAAILDKADAIRRKRKQAIKLADDFLRSVFLDMFGDPVTNPKGWEVKAIKELATVTTGNTPSRKVPEYFGNDVEWIKSDNINTPHLILTTATEYLSHEGVKVARTVPKGSTLITCIAGSFDCIGNAAFTNREVSFNQQINALTPKDGVLSWFLYALIIFSKKIIQNASTNSMKGMISKGKLEEVKLFLPPLDLQRQFEDVLDKQTRIVERMNSSNKSDHELFNSLSQKAFAGEL